MRVSLLLIATNNYSQFVKPLIESADKYFFNGWEKRFILFNDKGTSISGTEESPTIRISIPSYKFPLATLKRYEIFTEHSEMLKEFDYVFYCDIDMLFVDNVGVEILPNESELTVTQHPGFWKGGGSWGGNEKSTSFTPAELRKKYFAGGFQGGTAKKYLEMSKILSENINIDEKNGVMAEHHDETHFNKYVADKNPLILSPSYCFPENPQLKKWFNGGEKYFKPKLVALDKDHKKVRE